MAINYKHEGTTAFDDLSNKYKFKIGSGFTSGHIPNVVKKVVFGAVNVTEDYDSEGFILPLFKQKIMVETESNLTSDQQLEIKAAFTSNFKYEKTSFIAETVQTNATETEASKNTLFNKNYSYYNFKLPDYERRTQQVMESTLPSFLYASYNNYERNDYSALLLVKELPSEVSIAGLNSIGDFPSHSNTSKYGFNYHNHYDWGSNYYNAYFLNNLFADDDFSETSKNVFIQNYSSNTYMGDTKKSWYHVPYGNFINLPSLLDSPQASCRRAIELTHMVDIFMKLVSQSRADGLFTDTGDHEFVEIRKLLSIDGLESKNPEMLSLDRGGLGRIGISLFDPDKVEHQRDGANLFSIMMATQEVYYAVADKLKESALDLADIMHNKSDCYNEPMFYEVVKIRNSNNAVVQTFYFHIASDSNEIKRNFIDTQVRYGEEYTYHFYAHYLNFEYDITAETTNTNSGGHMEFDFRIQPKVSIVRVNLGSVDMVIVEPPPRKPIIKFSNYTNKDNKIKLILEDRTGIRRELAHRHELTTISAADNAYRDKLISYNKSLYPYYSSVSSYGTFEIYRTEEKPKSIRDFDGKLVQVVTGREPDQYSRKRNEKTSTVHYLEHSKKYYYLFRALTHHGNYSNPSPVYEVEKIKDSDETILRVRTIKMAPMAKDSYDMSFRKFLKISYPGYHVSAATTSPNGEPTSAFDSDIELTLGNDELPDALWRYNSVSGSHIKLRLESKRTGKKIDLNLVFNYDQPKIN